MMERGMIQAHLKKLWLRSPTRQAAKKRSRVNRNEYKCNHCEEIFTHKEVQIDHISPIGKFENWDIYIQRLFCDVDNLQVLCIDCHLIKTNSERK